MLITKFNKLIRSRIVWMVLAVTVAVFFVGASVLSRSGSGNANEERAAEGSLFGNEIGGDEFYLARYFELGMRPMADHSDEAVKALRERTWRRLAALHMAETMGLGVTDADVRDGITTDPSFTSNGAFDQRRYMAFLQGQLRIDPPTFENYLRQDLTLRKLMAALRTATWTAPYEVGPRLRQLTDEIQLEIAVIPPESHTNAVTLSDEEVAAHFEANRDNFRIPAQLRVRYVCFPVSNLLAVTEVSDADIDDYYNAHLEDYTTTDTNGVEHVQPLEEAHDRIAAIVRETEARFETKDEATRFVMALAPDRYGQTYELNAAAEARGLTVMTSDWFTAEETIPGLSADPELTKAAFALVPNDPERYFSDAIVATHAVYVLADHDSRPERDPTLDEVRDRVVAAATLKASEEAFKARIASTREQLVSAVADTAMSFSAQAEALGLMTSTTGVFTVYEGLPDDDERDDSRYVLSEIIDAKAGDVTEAIETPDGMLLAYVASRQHGDPSAAELLRPQFLQSLDRYRSAAVFEDWRDQILAQADFQDYHPVTD
jgi:peptidyl-prolyl cis-trans isomerase D